MSQKKSLHPLHKPVHPIFPALVSVIGICVLGILFASIWRNNPAPQLVSQQSQPPTPTPDVISVAPAQVDMSTWNTYIDWKYGDSIKLPPEYNPMIPGRGAINNPGGGEMDFDSSQYGIPSSNFSFHVRLNKGNHRDISCSTDEECYQKLFGLENPSDGFQLETTILNKSIKGFAVDDGSQYGYTELYYPFTHDGQSYELNIYDIPASRDQLVSKLPYVDAIASTISFTQ